MKRRSLTCSGLLRSYLLYSPASPRSLVVFLHGKGATAAWADEETGWHKLARREGFALAIPEGLPPDPDSPPRFLNNPQRWIDGSPASIEVESSGEQELGRTGKVDDVAFLEAVIDDVFGLLGSPLPVAMTGFSNGAGMTFRFAADHADRVVAIAPVAGHCWVSQPRPARQIPTLFIIGSADPLLPLRGGAVVNPWTSRLVTRPAVHDSLERWASAIGCSPVPIVGDEAGETRTDVYPGPVPFHSITIEGMGHHWPGGKGQLNPRIAGQPNDRVNGTEMVWHFFRNLI